MRGRWDRLLLRVRGGDGRVLYGKRPAGGVLVREREMKTEREMETAERERPAETETERVVMSFVLWHLAGVFGRTGARSRSNGCI